MSGFMADLDELSRIAEMHDDSARELESQLKVCYASGRLGPAADLVMQIVEVSRTEAALVELQVRALRDALLESVRAYRDADVAQATELHTTSTQGALR